LAIVLPDGVLANTGTDYVRQWLAEHMKIRAIASLPIETFSPFGAKIKTSVLIARKWKSGERRSDAHRVHLVKVDNVGYDSTGRLVAGSELATAAASVRGFLAAEGW
jgi:type I restriction enzyme M protein